jgi:DNA-binding LytR/AlgR family response regulator
METIRCLVVEDEPLSQEIMERYISQTPSLELAAICNNALQASGFLRKTHVDLIFLDINLPGISGMSFLRSLNLRPMIIFTTAYPEYAVEGFEEDAVDYLLKPFPFERFLKAVNKAFERSGRTGGKSGPETTESREFINIRADRKIHRVKLSEIQYLEARGDYLKVQLDGRSLIIHETVKNILELLPSGEFLRVHKSFIIPLSRVRFLEGNQLNVDGTVIPVGQVYREGLLSALKSKER